MSQLESFFWGIIAGLGALVLELLVFITFSFGLAGVPEISFAQLFSIPQFILIGVFIEELLKYTIISKRIDLMSLGRTYILNSFFVGLGFFSIEMGLISMSGSLPGFNLLLEIALVHIGTAGLMGFIVAIRNPKKFSTLVFAIVAAGLFHTTYNLLALKRTFFSNYAILVLLGILVLFNLANLIRINKRLAQD